MSAPVDPPSALRLGYGPLQVEWPDDAKRMALAGDSSMELFVANLATAAATHIRHAGGRTGAQRANLD